MGVCVGTVERVKLPCFEQETQAGAWSLRSVRRTIHAMTRTANRERTDERCG